MSTVGLEGYAVANNADNKVEDIMDALKNAVEKYDADGDTEQANMKLENVNGNTTIQDLGLLGVDVSSGGGALLMDHTLQGLSTQSQTAAQIVSTESKLRQQVKNAGQG